MIKELKRALLKEKRFEFSVHAVDQSILRKITIEELFEAVADGEIIEDYPQDKYGPSCLIFGRTIKNRPIHIQCSYPGRNKIKIITIYEPDAEEWIECKIRRKI